MCEYFKTSSEKIELVGQSFAQHAGSTQINLAQRLSLKSLNFSKGKYNNVDKEESAITEKFNEIS